VRKRTRKRRKKRRARGTGQVGERGWSGKQSEERDPSCCHRERAGTAGPDTAT